jgi:hypothetical protein
MHWDIIYCPLIKGKCIVALAVIFIRHTPYEAFLRFGTKMNSPNPEYVSDATGWNRSSQYVFVTIGSLTFRTNNYNWRL